MDPFEDRFFMLARKVATFLGFFPFQTYEERFLRSCIVSFSLTYAMFAQLCQLLTLDFNLRSIILVLQLLLPFFSTITIYYTVMLQFAKVQRIFRWILLDCLQLKDEVELKIMQKHINETKLFGMVIGCIVCLYISTIILPSILQMILSTNKATGDIHRYPLFSFVDYFLGPGHYYYPIVIYQILTVVLSAMVAITCYSTYLWFIQHTCARLSIVKNKLHQPFINNHRNDNILAIPHDYSHWMIDIIQHLTRTVQFMALTNETGETSYLLQVSMMFILLILCVLCLFQMPSLLKHKEDREYIFTFSTYIFTILLPLFMHCSIGQRLINYSIDVYREACLVPIHDVSLKTQKLLLTMLMIHAKPCAISIGNIFVSSHEFFSDLLRSSVSFAIVLHSIQST